MSQLNDAILAAVKATGADQINDGLVRHYQANGAISNSLNDAEYEFLVANGATPAIHVQDMWKELLPAAVGFDGQLNDMLLPFWLAGGTFSPPAPPSFDPTGWPASFEATEETPFTFDCKPYWSGGGFISIWTLSGDVPSWMTIGADGIIRGTPPLGDGNYGNVTVTGNNATGPAASATPIPVNTPANVTITFDPQPQFGEIGQAVTFAAAADNATGYQWYKNGSPIPGATSMVYTTPAVTQADNDAEYFCRIAGTGISKDTQKSSIKCMQTYNNIADGSGTVVRQITLAVGLYTLSMSGSGFVELSEVTASIIGIG